MEKEAGTLRWIVYENNELVAGTSLRDEGFSTDAFACGNVAAYVGDDEASVIRNRKDLAEAVGIPLDHWVYPQITHSDILVEVKRQDQGEGTLSASLKFQGVDALYTKETDLVLSVFHADCTPILIHCPKTKIVAAIHAGWPGTIKEIVSKCLDTLIEKEKIEVSTLRVFIGPCLCQDHLEIDRPVLDKMKTMTFDVSPFLRYRDPDHAYFDMVGCNVHQLVSRGVPMENIEIHPECTYEDPLRFYSYRKEKVTGRHVSFIAMKK